MRKYRKLIKFIKTFYMKKNLFFILFLLFYLNIYTQNNFEFLNNKKIEKINFKLLNNLIIFEVEVNQVKLNFLLDTGVDKTVLFSLDNVEKISLEKVEKIKIRGLGAGENIEALVSVNNMVKINSLVDTNHEIYVILDQEINFSSQLGIPVHGIIGHSFFKNFVTKIDYTKSKITVYNNQFSISEKVFKNYDIVPITIELEKPYFETKVTLNKNSEKVKLLIDTGGSDAIWLFENENLKIPLNNFDDFLGRGFSGNIYGKKAYLDSVYLGSYKLNKATVSFPDSESLKSAKLVSGRNGSVGSDFLKKFHLIFDYKNKKMYAKKNVFFNEKLQYNLAGLEIEHAGVDLIKEEILLKTRLKGNEHSFIDNSPSNFTYKFSLKPAYEITQVRKNSPAEKAGLKIGDKLIFINGKRVFNLSLDKIMNHFFEEEGKKIELEIERNKITQKYNFDLKNVF